MSDRAPVPRGSRGVSLAEILIAMVVMGMALVPVFGVLTGGVVRSDVSVTFETASNLASSIMNTLLATSTSFDDLVAGIPGAAVKRHPGPSGMPNLLGDQGTAPNRFFVKGRTKYRTELFCGSYPATGPTSLAFSYYANPQVFWEMHPEYSSRIMTADVISPADFTNGWSPYTCNDPTKLMGDKSAYGTRVVTIGAGDPRLTDQPVQLLKMVLYVRWGDDWGGGADARGSKKQLAFMSFKARP